MRRAAVPAALVVLLVLAAPAAPCAAQDGAGDTDDDGGVEVELGATLQPTVVWRSGDFDRIFTGDRRARDDAVLDPVMIVRADVRFSQNVEALVEVRTPRSGPGDPAGRPVWGRHVDPDGEAFEPEFTRAQVRVWEVFHPDVSVRAGLTGIRYELRGDGQAFFLGTSAAEDPFDGNPIGVPRFGPVNPDGAVQGDPGRTLGGLVTWAPRDLDPDLFVDIGGAATGPDPWNDHRSLWLVNVDRTVGERSLVNGFGALMSADGDHWIVSGGVGADLWFDLWESDDRPSLELFGEWVGQWGRAWGPGERPPGQTGPQFGLARNADTVEHRSVGARVGARFAAVEHPFRPWLEVSWVTLGGDDGEPDGTSRDFLSWEDVDTFRILDDDTWGLDLDHNLRSLRVRTGARLRPDLHAWVGWARARRQATPFSAPLGRDQHASVGDEFDLVVEWRRSETFAVRAGFAALVGADWIADAFDADDDLQTAWLELEWEF